MSCAVDTMYNDRPVVGTAASKEVRRLLEASSFDDLYGIGEAMVELQIKLAAERDKKLRAEPAFKTLFDIDFVGALNTGADPKDDVSSIVGLATEKGLEPQDLKKVWTWTRLPYAVRTAGLAVDDGGDDDKDQRATDSRAKKRSKIEGVDELVDDQDDWIIQNENHLRFLSRKAALPSSDLTLPWTYGLVPLSQLPSVITQPHDIVRGDAGSPVALKIRRPTVLSGFCILGEKRKSEFHVQVSPDAFREQWETMTDGVLKGLDWSNVFVAGGLVLGTMLTPQGVTAEGVHKTEEWQSSDIDLYIYGLTLDKANEKIKEIAKVYKANLPPKSPFLVVRNSQTITLYSKWPTKRVQIVLKLINSPREVLLNFDLDPCAIGYDGTDAWMLPRFVRALETGYTNFTMDIINGHYLGDRKASRDPRVFKYANKGFGLRILPSYVASLSTYRDDKQTAAIARRQPLYSAPMSLEVTAEQARKWTSTCIKKLIKRGHKNVPMYYNSQKYPKIKTNLPVLSHAILESNMQRTSEPLGRSCLTGFALLMRHVALWEEEVKGNIFIYDQIFAENTYGEGLANFSYDDTPEYSWDKEFKIADFCKKIDKFNASETKGVFESIQDHIDIDPTDHPVKRLTYADSVEEVLLPEKDIKLVLVLSPKFVDYANKVLVDALASAGYPGHANPLEVDQQGQKPTDDCVATWRLDTILNWQMLDRRIDEVREILWAYHRAFEHMTADPAMRAQLLMAQISKRAIRQNVEDEHEAFVIWVGRKPYHISSTFNVHFLVSEFTGLEVDDEDDEGEDEE